MDPNHTLFFAEMYSLVKKMEETIQEFEMKDRDESAEMKTMYSFNLESRAELETVKEIMDSAYQDNDSLDDLLGDLGISLN